MFLAVIAHEELLDFETARVPPGDANEKRVGAGASGEPGRFGVEEEPLSRVGNSLARAGRHQTQRLEIQLAIGNAEIRRAGHRLREPFP